MFNTLFFQDWLLAEERLAVEPSVLASYDRAFDSELERAIRRCAKNPPLRRSLEAMRGTQWASYILGALLRHCPRKVELEDALNYIAFRMLSPVSERGESRLGLFDIDPNRQYDFSIGDSPFLARFRTFLNRDVLNVCQGRVRRVLASVRPSGTVSITQARRMADQETGTVRADEIPDHPQSGEQELYDDLLDLLQQQSTPAWPLADLFHAILNGVPLKVQRQRFGHTRADAMRRTLKTLLRDYGMRTGNVGLVALLDKYEDATRPNPNREPRPKPAPKPIVPDEVRDFRSIIDVIQKAGGSASMSVLASKRSRWLSRKPRNPASIHRTRLHDVLATMVEKGVLAKRGPRYELGPHYQEYLASEPGSGMMDLAVETTR